MAKRTEPWKAILNYWWRGWKISKDKGWYSITLQPGPLNGRVRVPIRFKRLGAAKKYCETLDTLVDRTSLTAGHQWLDRTICTQATDQIRLDHSHQSVADEIRELGEELKGS